MAQAYTPTPWKPKGDPAQLLVTSARLNNIETGLVLASAPIVTTLPASPVDGQECNLLADATNGVVWHLVYRASSGKWHFTGGPPLFSQVLSFSNLNQGGYFDWSGPSITVPVAGDYGVAFGFRPYKFDAGKFTAYMSFQVGATAASDNDAAQVTLDQDFSTAVSREVVKTGVPAAAALSSRFRDSGGVWSNSNAWMRVQPIRVG